ncbi:NADPH-dependent 7-cyano-7-deazaguanine reductase QueF [Moraxella nasovis]|uniref:NADPH-dependent 7-cyano-7-deazaguanine reductase QueF n=1 Tax=Moraxella nasovis TaxID=2904121 RepID=UPI001F60D68F|nr:NADPH-dependent 7-cyano-7-deazaguanine reductase QueF [Moraxella nasovis]UNU73663.1 NADPH-dependent 7-cyano-7-deazaguanine reductase QueF [Moraxella nasovis]
MSIHGVLGENTTYPKTYNPAILYPISRQIGRDEILKETGFDFNHHKFKAKVNGLDAWQAFEISWLNPIGVSQVAMARFFIPSDSPNIVESKSLKLYLNSLNFTKFNHITDVQNTIKQDLSNCVGVDIEAQIIDLDSDELTIFKPMGICIDECLNELNQEIALSDDIDNSFLKTVMQHDKKSELKTHQFYSNLLRSNCPVTNQPDWGTVQVEISTEYDLDFGQILKYILSFRKHNGFHEQCVERIFADFMTYLKPTTLKVAANYTRRGGIDINPVRVYGCDLTKTGRLVRQ